jgi:hypothetical protein
MACFLNIEGFDGNARCGFAEIGLGFERADVCVDEHEPGSCSLRALFGASRMQDGGAAGPDLCLR